MNIPYELEKQIGNYMSQVATIIKTSIATAAISLLGFYIYQNEARLKQVEKVTTQTAVVVQEIKSILVQDATNISYTDEDKECMAKNIFYEAGVESNLGKVAVGHVTINRLKTKRWGDSICSVVYAKKQFSWTICKRKRAATPSGPLWRESQIAADMVLTGTRVRKLEKSLFYHTDYIKTPKWVDAKAKADKIDQHIFYTKALVAPTTKKTGKKKSKKKRSYV